jgi:hypothetical protein
MMSDEERLRILREAKPNSWVAFSGDESRIVASADTYSQVVEAAQNAGEDEPIVIKIPESWSSMAF